MYQEFDEQQSKPLTKLSFDMSRFRVKKEEERSVNAWAESTDLLFQRLKQNEDPKFPLSRGRMLRELKVMGIRNAGDVLAFMKECENAPCRFGQAYGQRLKNARETKKRLESQSPNVTH